jgi:transketolase
MEIAECRSGNTVFRMIVSNRWEQGRVATLATKEPETVQWIAGHFGPGDTLFDIGANVGIYAILAAAQNPAGTVVAVEPMAVTFARLCDNARLNDLANLRPYCVAIGAENGVSELQLVSLDAASSMHSLGTSGLTFGEPVITRTGIGVVTIDSLAAAAGVPALMKIDVDGGEDDVLAGATTVLHDRRLRSVLIEFNWVAGAPHPRRDAPLLRAGFTLDAVGSEYDHGEVHWQNAIYRRG